MHNNDFTALATRSFIETYATVSNKNFLKYIIWITNNSKPRQQLYLLSIKIAI